MKRSKESSTTSKRSKAAFTIVFDKDRSQAFLVMFNYLVTVRGEEFAAHLVASGKAVPALELLDEISDKHHEVGWCNDPECSWKK